jgi:hypothetical protein
MQSNDLPPIDPGMLGGDTFVPCHIKQLPPDELIVAARNAVALNPLNAVTVASASARALANILPPEHIAVMTGKRWPAGEVITIGFLESTPADLQARILAHANSWRDRGANISFALTRTDPMIRLTREGEGYWSYLGTDILSIPAGQPTLCLQGFSMATPESEYRRVVRHEIGHSLSAPHEHMRSGIVARLDPARTIAYFQRTQGWSAQMVKQQVLTPLDEASLMGTPVDVDSIMAYSLPAFITKDGRPVPGGSDIDDSDAAWMAKIYPGLTVTPPAPVPPAPLGPGSKPTPAAPQLRGSVGPKGVPFLVYVTDPAVGPGEQGYRFRGKAWISERDHVTIVYKGQADRLSAAGSGALPGDLAAVEVPGADD